MVAMFRALNSSILITASPECPTTAGWFKMSQLIAEAPLDALFIQFYNNPMCDHIEGTADSDRFNFDDWENVIATSKNSKDASLYIGLAANRSNSAYVPPDVLETIIRKYQNKPHFGGIALWDMYQGSVNEVDGRSYNEWIRCILKTGCHSASTAITSGSKQSATRSPADSESTSPGESYNSGTVPILAGVKSATCLAGFVTAVAVTISFCCGRRCFGS